MYKVEDLWAEVPLSELRMTAVDVAKFLDCCKACTNYNKVWSCPPYSFDPQSIWNSYETLTLCCRKVVFSDEARAVAYPQEELGVICKQLMQREQDALLEKMMELEKLHRGSMALAAGSCSACAPLDCARISGQRCRFPEKIRYSIESLGGNVGLTCRKLMGLNLEWMEEGKVPSYFVLCAGLLHP
jgi:predicted metal-binding protein